MTDEISGKPWVPVGELKALVDEWRDMQQRCDLPRSGLTGEGYVAKNCADELEDEIKTHYDKHGLEYNTVEVAELSRGAYRLSVDGMFVCKFEE